MNKYDERYEIRLGKISDISNIMQFLNDHWKKGHILSVDRTLFEYEFKENNSVNMILAIDRDTNTIEALAGFLKCSNTPYKNRQDIWGSIWKVNTDRPNMTFLGVQLIQRLNETLNCRLNLGIGVNPKTSVPVRTSAFHEKSAKMDHYYFLNPCITDFCIAKVTAPVYKPYPVNVPKIFLHKFFSVADIKEVFDIEALDTVPYKDFWYIDKRFFKHPHYTYQVYGLHEENNTVSALLVTRVVEHNNHRILRIVDYIGDQKLFSGLGSTLHELMIQEQYEYIDFYTFGFNKDYVQNAGFILKTSEDPNIIPNYFEPFVQENVDIWVRYTDDRVLFCKADGDQDRPNLVQNN